MLEILLDNKNGNVWDISEIVTDISYKTYRIGKPSSLSFTLIKGAIYQDASFSYNNGDIIRMKYENQNVFYGYIFTIDGGKDENVKITCYDQIRYLLAKDTYVFSNTTATNIIKKIANDFSLNVGVMENTGYVIPKMVEDGQKLLDIIDKALTLTLVNSNKNYVFYDDFGLLTIKNVENMLIDFYIGDDSLMYDYKSTKSIDQDTYNKIKLYKDDKKAGKREVYLAQDSSNISKWGVLQLYEKVDEKMNQAQINQMLNQMLKIKNKESKTLRLDCIGDIRIRAGNYVPIVIEEYEINQPFIIDQCTHKINGSEHTMSIDLKVI
ncbi:XkdQ/YqbQ family protein [Anaerophilus nitritogenes]|uniref:XkdQ/YqbQ family protein n=1 Tax=Anaerophilus nitritogenes TaxID=2498136 RepID=UPI00101B96F2|nr:hypothetical protein [Anaerophilus nitritogenes]